MIANILSLDMDWFNCFDENTLKQDIDNFFLKLSKRCIIPKVIDIVPEHHYLFPWGLGLLKRFSCRMINVLNIDEHHDFYYLHSIDFNEPQSYVTCGNFFAFMADRHIIKNYTWVSLAVSSFEARKNLADLRSELRSAKSATVRRFCNKVQVRACKNVYKSLYKRFDGFFIVRSPKYTLYPRTVYHAVDRALETHFSDRKVNRYSCRKEYQQASVFRISRKFLIA